MNVSEQCGIAALTGKNIVGLIRRNITYEEKKLIIPLHKAIVRPHLQYWYSFWAHTNRSNVHIVRQEPNLVHICYDMF